MADDELVSYKDISELKRELEGVKGRKEVPQKDLYDAVQKLTQVMTDMLDVFGAAAEQLKLEEAEYAANTKKYDAIVSKMDKIVEQNRTIAEGMVAIVELIKEKWVGPAAKDKGGQSFKFEPEPDIPNPQQQEWQPKPEPSIFKPQQVDWQPKPEPMMPKPQLQQAMAPPIPAASPTGMAQLAGFETGMPPMQPEPLPDLELEDPFKLDDEPKKKGLFGMFKK